MRDTRVVTGQPEGLAALCHLWRRERREVCVTLQGSSMWPSIPAGSTVRLACGTADIAPGDVVAVLQGGRLVIHRLVRIEAEDGSEPVYLCQGDANAFLDPPATRAQIVGRVIGHRPPSRLKRYLGALSRRLRWLRSPVA